GQPQQFWNRGREIVSERRFDLFLIPEANREGNQLTPRQHESVARLVPFQLARLYPAAELSPAHSEESGGFGDGVGRFWFEEQAADCGGIEHADTHSRWRLRRAQVQMRYECATKSFACSASASASSGRSEVCRKSASPSW